MEISVSSTPAEVAETVGKCIVAGFTHVVVVATDGATLRRAENSCLGAIPAKDRSKIRFLTPDGLKSFLDELSTPADEQDLTAGYIVRVAAPKAARMPHRRALARLVGTALLRRRPS